MEIKVVKKVLSANDTMAQQNRKHFSEKKVFVLNMMSSPGSGKTSILEQTVGMLLPEINSAIIVGDICTTNDADRLAKTGFPLSRYVLMISGEIVIWRPMWWAMQHLILT
jgi:hydrogenase nickel incorporation protein HypB